MGCFIYIKIALLDFYKKIWYNTKKNLFCGRAFNLLAGHICFKRALSTYSGAICKFSAVWRLRRARVKKFPAQGVGRDYGKIKRREGVALSTEKIPYRGVWREIRAFAVARGPGNKTCQFQENKLPGAHSAIWNKNCVRVRLAENRLVFGAGLKHKRRFFTALPIRKPGGRKNLLRGNLYNF